MTKLELRVAFERETGILNALEKPSSEDIEYWLNFGLNKFIKTRYSGNNVKGQGFEASQKRIDDLRTLVCTAEFKRTNEGYSYYYNFCYETETPVAPVKADAEVVKRLDMYTYILDIPSNYMLALGEDATIVGQNDDWETDVDNVPIPKVCTITEATVDNITEKLTNKLSKYRMHRNTASPLRITTDDKIKIYTDENYLLQSYTLTYLRTPTKIDIHTSMTDEYADMPKHTHIEIVKLAAQAYLENQSNQRYQTYSNEINTME